MHPTPNPSDDRAKKLYVITRQDLPAGHQVTQAAHATAAFCQESTAAATWYRESNSLIILSVPDERALYRHRERLAATGVVTVEFREPDFGYELTAIACEPSERTRRLCSSLPLALRNVDEDVERRAVERLRETTKLVASMRSCEQTRGLDVLEHGWAVRTRARQLVEHLNGAPLAGEWRLPGWFDQHRAQIAAEVVSDYVLDRATIWHDCGKPAVRTVDDVGVPHFPDHAEASAVTYMTFVEPRWAAAVADGSAALLAEALGGAPLDEEVTTIVELLRRDMDLHLLRGDHVGAFAGTPLVATQLIIGLAEIHANAEMFGGIESTGFKMKWKHLDRRGRAVCKTRWGTSA